MTDREKYKYFQKAMNAKYTYSIPFATGLSICCFVRIKNDPEIRRCIYSIYFFWEIFFLMYVMMQE